jgi:signal transduction histidine kinase
MSPMGSTRMTAAAIAAAVMVTLGASGVSLAVAVTDSGPLGAAVIAAAFAIAAVAVGAVVAAARPDNRVGWAMLVGSALSALGGVGADLAHHGIVTRPGTVPAVAVFAIGGSAVRSLGWYVLTLGVPLVFPDGKVLPSKRNWLPRAFVVILVASVIDPLTDKQADLTGLGHWQNPIGLHRPWDLVSAVAFLGHVPLSVVVTIGLIVQLRRRYRTGTPLMRQQLRLFLAAAALPVVAVPIVFAISYSLGPWVFAGTVVPLPIAIGFAVLARGLYDLRTAVNRTLVWLTLSAVVAAVYALVIAGIGNRVDMRGASWLPWLAAAVVAVSFAPLRDLLQRGVNRVTFGRWEQPYDVLAALGQRLEAAVDVHRLLVRVVDELHGLDLGSIAIIDADGRVILGPDDSVGAHRVPLTAYGRRVGTLHCTLPPGGLRRRDRQLLDDLAGHLAGVLHAYALTAQLQLTRERLVLAREEERRRLRRDLHDGLGPSLAGHLLRLDVVAAKVAGQPAVTADLDSLRDELRATMLDVRRVVEGLRPPALDELGLRGAVEQAVSRLTGSASLRTEVTVSVPDRLPAAVEVAAYRIVTEAVTNVVRHASASSCRVDIVAAGSCLSVDVADDGRGLDPTSAYVGHGLATMRERAEELGGTLSIRSAERTHVSATLPLAAVPTDAASPLRLEVAQ